MAKTELILFSRASQYYLHQHFQKTFVLVREKRIEFNKETIS